MNKLFSFEIGSGAHYQIIIFGIKIRILKPYLKKMKENYIHYQNPSDVPQASGKLREFQCANLTLLKLFHKACEEKNLKYWIDFGTLLGAVRHGGFIPWDDDIDLGMLRDDYDKLISEFSHHPYLEAHLTGNGRNKCYIKVTHRQFDKIFLDIFPYDYYYKKTNETEKKELHQLIGNWSKKLKKTFFEEKNLKKLQEKFIKITNDIFLEGNSADKNSQPSIFWGIDFPHAWKNRVYDWEEIFPLCKIKFEDYEFYAPKEKEKVLKNIYNDYMKLPKDIYPRHAHILGLSESEEKYLAGVIEQGKNL